MKYQQKSFSHGYADSKSYAKNFDAIFRGGSAVRKDPLVTSEAPVTKSCTTWKPRPEFIKHLREKYPGVRISAPPAPATWEHDTHVKHFKECCPCSKCADELKCSGPDAWRDVGVTGHCQRFMPKGK